MTRTPTRPFEGIAVLEMGSSLAGPFAARILAELGAWVIKVEDPRGGDVARTWGSKVDDGQSGIFHAFNRGKRSITVNFTDRDDARRLRALIEARIDVVVQNLRPGAASRYGFGEELRRDKPSLIYCNAGAYGREGPLSGRPGYDPLMQAFTGLMASTGSADGPPSRTSSPMIDVGNGMWSAMGIMAALYHRAQTGEGCTVDTALFETALSLQTVMYANYVSGGDIPQRNGPTGPLAAPNSAFEAADGLLMITAGTQGHFKRLCEVIGRPDLAADPRFAEGPDRYANRDALRPELEAALRTQTREYWHERLVAVDVPNGPVQSVDEVVAHPHTQASGILQREPESEFRSVALPLRFDGKRPKPSRPAPLLGEGNSEILGE